MAAVAVVADVAAVATVATVPTVAAVAAVAAMAADSRATTYVASLSLKSDFMHIGMLSSQWISFLLFLSPGVPPHA